MTDNLPAGRPDFEPPDPGWVWQPSFAAPGSAATAVATPPSPSRPEPGALPPGPYKQPWTQPAPYPPAREARGSFLAGMAISMATLGVAWWLTIGAGEDSIWPTMVANGALSVSTAVLIVLGVLLALVPKTVRIGTGLLVGYTAAMFVAGVVWVSVVVNLVT
ncbi:MAG: hypothetical protein LCH96_11480 [Actinobacteria bacterium]|nr:hypothetical protein [Actinomycetota bacterium]